MKLLEVGDEHYIAMNKPWSVMFHHQEPIAAIINGQKYRLFEIPSLMSIGHVKRYLGTVRNEDLHWVSQVAMEQLVEAL